MELKSAKPKSRLRYLRILFFIPAIASLGVIAYSSGKYFLGSWRWRSQVCSLVI
ncbi:MAG: hypothetical protein ACK6CP_19245 [Pseudanabaena sp.]